MHKQSQNWSGVQYPLKNVKRLNSIQNLLSDFGRQYQKPSSREWNSSLSCLMFNLCEPADLVD